MDLKHCSLEAAFKDRVEDGLKGPCGESSAHQRAEDQLYSTTGNNGDTRT